MATFILTFHGWIRWILIFGSLGLSLASFAASAQGKPWGGAYKKATVFMAMLVSVQLLLGILLHSVLGTMNYSLALLHDPSAFFKTRELRFFGMEHPITAILAVGLMHMGLAKAKRLDEAEGARAHKIVAFTQMGALLFLLMTNPWFRPFFR